MWKKIRMWQKDQFQEWISQKNQQFMSNSSLQFIFFKMSINNPLKWKISTKISIVFPGLEPILYAGQKLWLTAKFFRKLFLVVECPTKKIKKLVEKTFRKKVENNRNKLVFFKLRLAFITYVNYEHAYLVENYLHILFSHFAFGKKEKKTKKKFVETVAVCRVLLDYDSRIAK